MTDDTGEPNPANILRHKERTKPFELVGGDENHIKLIEDHITQHIGAPDIVYHELVSDLVHIDVQIIHPTADRNFFTLVTTGMSMRAMKTPEGAEEFSYAELMLCLPPDWLLSQEDYKDENNYWPIRLLKMLARLPHEYDTWLGFAHSIPNGDPAEPYAPGTKFCGAMLAPPCSVPEEFFELKVSPEMTIHFFAVLPLYAEEMQLKLDKGSDALFDQFDKHEVTELVNLSRRNVAKKRFGIF
jgi:hypothetical protein